MVIEGGKGSGPGQNRTCGRLRRPQASSTCPPDTRNYHDKLLKLLNNSSVELENQLPHPNRTRHEYSDVF